MNDTFNEIELRKLDLNLLLVFAALMRERSVSRAASRLYLGPSAVSMALGRLRETLGDDLFVRSLGVMEPTARALALWSKLNPALTSINQAMRDFRDFDPATAETVIRFAAPDDLEFVLIPELLARLAEEAPRMRLVVRPSDFRTLLGRLDSGDADLGLSANPVTGVERRHHTRPLYTERFAALFDPRLVKAKKQIDLKTYVATPHILLSIAGDLHGSIDDTLSEMGYSRTVLAAVSHFPTIPFILKRRRALANVPAVAAHYYGRAYELRVCPTPFRSPEFEVSLLWHSRTHGDPAQIWFRDLVADAVRKLRTDVQPGLRSPAA